MRYSPPAFARRAAEADRALINFDELTTSAPSVSKAMLRIFQEREVGELPLPATVALVASANPPAVAVDGWELPPPIANRLMHLQWVFDADEWLTGVTTDFAHQVCPPLAAMLGPGDAAAKARARGAVTAYLRAHRDQINALPRVERRGTGGSETAAVDPQQASGAWPSPRSWTNAMAAMEQLHDGDDEARYLVQTGVGVQGVGDSAGVRGNSEDTGVRGKGGVGVFGEGGYGVTGRGKYIGVLAAGDIAVRAEGYSIGTYSMAPTAVRAEGSVVGALASGEGNGVGVKSRSPNNRAGVFIKDDSSPDVDFADFPIRDGESAPQICLAAGSARETDQDILPSMGVAGDMVAFTRRRGDNVQAELWFCTRTNDDGNGAWWAKVQLGPTVIVT